MSHNTRRARLSWLVVSLLATTAAATAPKPRVLVILDSSRSMLETPQGITDPMTGNLITYGLTDVGGDYDPSAPQACTNKFCSAKEVVYNIMPQYSGMMRIGLSTYNQYLLRREQPDTRNTVCTYDVVQPAGLPRSFMSTTDYTGSGTAVPSDSPMPIFPPNLSSTCADDASGATRYTVRKTAASPNVAYYYCSVWTRPTNLALPKTGTQLGRTTGSYICDANVPFSASATKWTVPNVNVAVATSATTCPAVVTVAGNTPSGPPSTTATSDIASYEGGSSLRCTTAAGCELYSNSNTPFSRTSNRHWFLLAPANPPASTQTGSSSGYTYADRVGTSGVVNGVLTGTTTNQASCHDAGIYTTGSTSTFNIANALATLNANTTLNSGWTSSTHDRVNASSSSISCTGAFPCQVSATATPNASTWTGTGTYHYTQVALPANQRYSAVSNQTFSYWRMSNTSCSASFSATNTSPPAGTLWRSTPSGTACGTGALQCNFTASTSATASSPCPATSYTYTSTAVIPASSAVTVSGSTATCTYNGQNYTKGAAQWGSAGWGGAAAGSHSINNVPASAACPGPAVGSSQDLSAAVSNSTGSVTCSSGYPCTVRRVADTAVAGTTQNTYTNSPPAAGWTLLSTGSETYNVNPGGTCPSPTCSVSPACSATGPSTNSTVCGGVSACDITAASQVSTQTNGSALPSSCGTEGTSQCKQCRYTRRVYTWSSPPMKNCNYERLRHAWTVSPTATYCNVVRSRWQVEQQTPPTYTCNYSMPAQQVRFVRPEAKWCSYSAVGTELTGSVTTYTYTYTYQTKGGELVSSWSKSIDDAHYCSPTGQYTGGSSFETDCPATLNACSGIAGTTCRLRWGTAGAGTSVGTNRYKFKRGNDMSYANNNGRECMSADSWPASSTPLPADPNTYLANFCQQSGNLPDPQYWLVSDYYDPARATSLTPYLANIQASHGSGTYTWSKTWTNKTFGWSLGDGARPKSMVFIDVPDDAITDNAGVIRDAMRRCVYPTHATVNNFDWAYNGVCVAQEADRNVAPLNWSPLIDFTPLYGSLTNAADYMRNLYNADPEAVCRKYFLVLATDGLENTPANYQNNPTALPSLVGSFRGGPVGLDLKTFVIGFGAGAAGSSQLNDMATAGGTDQAFSATNQAQLQAALDEVLSRIVATTLTRARPTIATDGKRIYIGRYSPGLDGTTEWKGEFVAFKIDPNTGEPIRAWEFSEKLDQMNDSARDIRVAFPGNATPTRPLTAADTTVAAAVASSPNFPVTFTAAQVIAFVRNAGVPSNVYEQFASGSNKLSRLGSIQHGSAVVVGRSPYSPAYGGDGAEATSYQSFLVNTAARPTRVLFGSNTGMLHAAIEGETTTACTTAEDSMSCNNGKEAWGYVPLDVAAELYQTKQAGRATNVDGVVTVADVCANASGYAQGCSSSQWHTVAISGLREGGRSYFAADITNTGSFPTPMWDFTHGLLGFSYGGPAIGRVNVAGNDRFLALFAGGANARFNGDCAVVSGGTCDPSVGKAVFAVDAARGPGTYLRAFSQFRRGATLYNFEGDGIARPAAYRRPDAPRYLDHAIFAMGSAMYVSRFAAPNGVQHPTEADWVPREFFDPTSSANATSIYGTTTQVRQVYESVPGNGTTPPVYGLRAMAAPYAQLPFAAASAPPIQNRPKSIPVIDPAGTVTDYFVGTGNAQEPDEPWAWDSRPNFFYAIHDTNTQSSTGANDGAPIWVNSFMDGYEGVVSEPALVNGCVIVATYNRNGGDPCTSAGITKLYGFDPRTGNLAACLVYPAGNQYQGQNTSVIDLGAVGVPSDLIAINNNLYFATSSSGMQRVQYRNPPAGGDIRSYRRVR